MVPEISEFARINIYTSEKEKQHRNPENEQNQNDDTDKFNNRSVPSTELHTMGELW